MNFRPLGATGINCSILGLGTGRLASVSGGVSREAAARLLATARDSGINLIDTADSYGQGECEKILGHALAGRRDQFIIVSKSGYCFSSLGGGLRLLKPLAKRVLKLIKGGKNLAGNVRSNVSRQDFSPSIIRANIHASLQRLQTDHLDVFLLHSPPVRVMADLPLFDLLRQLQTEGKIRHFGVSSTDLEVVEAATKIPGLAVVQTPLSPAQTATPSLLSRIQATNIGVMANQIFLSGQLLNTSSAPAEDQAELDCLKAKLDQLAASRKISLHRLLLKYALAQPGVSTALTGTTRPEHLQQNVADALSPDAPDVAAALALA